MRLTIYFLIILPLIIFVSKPSYSGEDAVLLAMKLECGGNSAGRKPFNDYFFALTTDYTFQGNRYWIGKNKYEGDVGLKIFSGVRTDKSLLIKGEGKWLKKTSKDWKLQFISKGNKSMFEHLEAGVEGFEGKDKWRRECKLVLLNKVKAGDAIQLDSYTKVISGLKNQIDNLKKLEKDKENNEEEIKKINEEYNEKINSLENMIASLKEENEVSNKKIKELNDEVIKTKNNNEFKTKYEDLKKELDKVNKELVNNEKQLTKNENELIAYQEKEQEEIKRKEKEEEEKRIAIKLEEEKQIEEEKKKEERKINNLKYELGSSELVVAQNFINDLQDFIKNNPDEFDIVDIAELLIENKDIIDGNWGENSDLNFKKLYDFVNNSNNFLSYNLSKEQERFENAMEAMNEQYDLLLLKQTKLEELLNENLTSEFASDIIEKTKITRDVLSNYTFSRLTTTNKEIKEFLTNISIKIEQKNTEIKNKDIEISSFKSNYEKLQTLLSENLTTDNAPVILEKINELKVLNLDNFSSSEIKDLNKDISRFITTTFTKSLTNVSNIKTEENKVANSNETKSSEISSEQTNIVDLNPELIEFIKIVETAKLKYQEAKSDMAKGAVLSERNNQLVNLITRSIKKDEYDSDVQIGLIDNYQGELVKIGTNEEGRGKLGVVFGDDSFHLSTWDYAHEDALNYQDTLVPSNEPIYQSMLTLEEGDIVKVSGHLFMNEKLGHYDYQNPDLRSRVNDPYFVFKFTKIEKVN
tara:strand:+ start:951 stop:3209 length:2259 start_codon:yes stop_codon:yes gene_type:complete